MATKTIGATGRDYPTVNLWVSYLQGIGTLASQEIGECYNDSEFTGSPGINPYIVISGFTAGSGTEAILRCASGQSFKDNANVQTNALRYNQTNGVAMRKTDFYRPCLQIGTDYVQIEGIQFSHGSGSGNDNLAVYVTSSSYQNIRVDKCIFEVNGSNYHIAWIPAGIWSNCLFVRRTSGNGSGVNVDYPNASLQFINCTVVRPSDLTASGNGFSAASGTTTLKNCAVFGFTVDAQASRFSATTCATDDTTPTTGFTGSLTYSSQFQTTTNASRDFRLKAGANLLDAGTTDSTYAPVDIAGTSRPQGSAYDIGCWELVSAGGGTPSASVPPARHIFHR